MPRLHARPLSLALVSVVCTVLKERNGLRSAHPGWRTYLGTFERCYRSVPGPTRVDAARTVRLLKNYASSFALLSRVRKKYLRRAHLLV